MPNPVRMGDRLRLGADEWRKARNGGKAVQDQSQGLQAETSASPRDPDTVLVRNESGVDVGRFAVLEISGLIVNPSDRLREFQSRPALKGITPTDQAAGKYAVLQEPAANGKIARAVISGATVAKVKMQDASHRFAESLENDSSQLISAGTGSARILASEAVEGEEYHWAYVRLAEDAGTQAIGYNQNFSMTTIGSLSGVSPEPLDEWVQMQFTGSGIAGGGNNFDPITLFPETIPGQALPPIYTQIGWLPKADLPATQGGSGNIFDYLVFCDVEFAGFGTDGNNMECEVGLRQWSWVEGSQGFPEKGSFWTNSKHQWVEQPSTTYCHVSCMTGITGVSQTGAFPVRRWGVAPEFKISHNSTPGGFEPTFTVSGTILIMMPAIFPGFTKLEI